jgi:hypothetical protein
MQHRPPLIPYDSFAFVAEPPELPTRREGDSGSLEHVARAEETGQSERGIALSGTTQNEEPVNASVGIVAPGIVRVLLEGEERDPERVTLAKDLSAEEVVSEASSCATTTAPRGFRLRWMDPASTCAWRVSNESSACG